MRDRVFGLSMLALSACTFPLEDDAEGNYAPPVVVGDAAVEDAGVGADDGPEGEGEEDEVCEEISGVVEDIRCIPQCIEDGSGDVGCRDDGRVAYFDASKEVEGVVYVFKDINARDRRELTPDFVIDVLTGRVLVPEGLDASCNLPIVDQLSREDCGGERPVRPEPGPEGEPEQAPPEPEAPPEPDPMPGQEPEPEPEQRPLENCVPHPEDERQRYCCLGRDQVEHSFNGQRLHTEGCGGDAPRAVIERLWCCYEVIGLP